MPDFHNDFHGSALAHASLPVLQALDGTVGGGWRGEKEMRCEEKRERGWEGGRKKKQERREDDTLVNEHVHNAQN